MDYKLICSVSVPVVTTLYLLGRVAWVLSELENSNNDNCEGETPEDTDTVVENIGSNDRYTDVAEIGLFSSLHRISSVSSLRNSQSISMKLLSTQVDKMLPAEKETQSILFSLLIINVTLVLPHNIFKYF